MYKKRQITINYLYLFFRSTFNTAFGQVTFFLDKIKDKAQHLFLGIQLKIKHSTIWVGYI